MGSDRGFFGLPAPLMSALGTVLGFALLGQLDYNQQNVLGNWLELIGQVLETNSAQGQLLEARQQNDRLDALEQGLQQLQKRLEDHCSTAPTVADDSGGEENTT